MAARSILCLALFQDGLANPDALNLLQTNAVRHSHHRGGSDEHPRAYAGTDSLAAANDAEHENPEVWHDLDFRNMQYRNLGGLGPHLESPPSIRYLDVTEYRGEKVDLILEADGYNTTKPKKSGLHGHLAVVNILNGYDVQFTARFVNKNDAAIFLGPFHLSFFDIDTGKRGGQEELVIGGFTESHLLENTELQEIPIPDDPDGKVRFVAGQPGVGADNPSDALMLTDVQAARTVSLKFPKGLDRFTFTYKVMKNFETPYSWNEGRHFLMGGSSSLYFCDAEPVNMDLSFANVHYSNLDGQGPDFDSPKALRFSNVASMADGSAIDLTVKVAEGENNKYTPANVANNGLNGQFAQVNIRGASETRFKFTFLKGGTNEPQKLDWTYFSMYDLDQGKTRGGVAQTQETMDVSGFVTHYLTEASELVVKQHDKQWYSYTSSTAGTGSDNPTDPMALTEQQKNRAVTFLLHNVHTFEATFSATAPDQNGRNFLFAGKSSVVFC
jgi:hypothetical protein